MAVPLISGRAVLGVVSVTEPEKKSAFTRHDLAILRGYALPAALALSSESLRDQAADLAHLATVDALTGISNRRHFDERLTEEIQRARREHGELALLMIDIDDFKALNDARGHQSGDAVLRDVADILRRSIRSFDVCARYGGEEFAILMPGASTSTAYQIAERIRRHTESHFSDNWRYAAGVRPTLSIGVANATGETSGGTLVATADAALLWAKAAGKKRGEALHRHAGAIGVRLGLRGNVLTLRRFCLGLEQTQQLTGGDGFHDICGTKTLRLGSQHGIVET